MGIKQSKTNFETFEEFKQSNQCESVADKRNLELNANFEKTGFPDFKTYMLKKIEEIEVLAKKATTNYDFTVGTATTSLFEKLQEKFPDYLVDFSIISQYLNDNNTKCPNQEALDKIFEKTTEPEDKNPTKNINIDYNCPNLTHVNIVKENLPHIFKDNILSIRVYRNHESYFNTIMAVLVSFNEFIDIHSEIESNFKKYDALKIKYMSENTTTLPSKPDFVVLIPNASKQSVQLYKSFEYTRELAIARVDCIFPSSSFQSLGANVKNTILCLNLDYDTTEIGKVSPLIDASGLIAEFQK
jgi:hypothetical protein